MQPHIIQISVTAHLVTQELTFLQIAFLQHVSQWDGTCLGSCCRRPCEFWETTQRNLRKETICSTIQGQLRQTLHFSPAKDWLLSNYGNEVEASKSFTLRKTSSMRMPLKFSTRMNMNNVHLLLHLETSCSQPLLMIQLHPHNFPRRSSQGPNP